MIFKTYNLNDYQNLIYIYGKSNESVVQTIMQRLSESNPEKFISQFRDNIKVTIKHIKNNVKALAVIAKSHYDKSGLTNTENWPEKIKQ